MACNVCGGHHGSAALSTPAAAKSETDGRDCGPCPFIPSCETQNALADCFKKMFCDVLRCLGDAVKTSAHEPDPGEEEDDPNPFTECLKTAVLSLADCVPDALCGPRAVPPNINDNLPCDFAVEEKLALNAPKK